MTSKTNGGKKGAVYSIEGALAIIILIVVLTMLTSTYIELQAQYANTASKTVIAETIDTIAKVFLYSPGGTAVEPGVVGLSTGDYGIIKEGATKIFYPAWWQVPMEDNEVKLAGVCAFDSNQLAPRPYIINSEKIKGGNLDTVVKMIQQRFLSKKESIQVEIDDFVSGLKYSAGTPAAGEKTATVVKSFLVFILYPENDYYTSRLNLGRLTIKLNLEVLK